MNVIVNRIRNPRFALGKESPRHWEWAASDRSIQTHRRPHPSAGAGITFHASQPAEGFFRQTLACKPLSFYRVEATVSCNLQTAGCGGGFFLTLEYSEHDEGTRVRESPPLMDAPEAVSVRAYFDVPESVDRVRVGVGLRGASGWAHVQNVRFIRILEPDEMSHPLAILPPYRPAGDPQPVDQACIWSAAGPDRPLRDVLKLALGEANVRVATGATDFRAAEAVLLPDEAPPRQLRSLKSIMELAEHRTVLISLPAFARLARLRIRRVEQPDDPIHAKVVYANFASRGFALHDCFAYAWRGRDPDGFVQNQFRKSPQLHAFCRRHRFKTILVSSCDQDATSDQPICLYRSTPGGGLFVLDLDPVEAPASTMAEPTLAVHLLLCVLGRAPALAGQFSAPVRKPAHFQDLIREMANRWDHVFVHGDDEPRTRETHQLVTVGREDESCGLPLAPKPVILIRSGLRGGDAGSVYGVLAWFRHFLQAAGSPDGYAHKLASGFRLAWVPLCAAWESKDGWRGTHRPPSTPLELDLEEGQMASLIDVSASRRSGVRVVFSHSTPFASWAGVWLPRLRRIVESEHPAISTGDTGTLCPRTWHREEHPLEVAIDAGSFNEEIHRQVAARSGNLVRIELPLYESDYVSKSIAHTHLSATTLEQVVGLHYGVIAVNRSRHDAEIEGLGTIQAGSALILEPHQAGAPSDRPDCQVFPLTRRRAASP